MLRRWKRYIRFGIQYFLFEKPRGLDFTMLDTTLSKKSQGLYHGYNRTAGQHLKEIFDSLTFTGDDRILDIGCGKGAVLRVAAEYPFKKVAGIEISEKLMAIAVKNFQLLKMEDRVQCFLSDAVEFDAYKEYNVFFLFNPFSEPIMEIVVDKLLEVSKEKVITVIYHHPVYLELFRKKANLVLLEELYDSIKNYYTCIFEMGPLIKDE